MRKVDKKHAERSTSVKDDVVTCVHTTLHKASGDNYVLTTSFDFANVPRETVLRLATETALIRWRTAFKNADEVDAEADNQIVNVAKFLRGSKPRMSKGDRAAKVLADMTPEEIRAFVAKHKDMLGLEDVTIETPDEE